MKINIGAGDTKDNDYIRIDYDALTNPDFVLDLEKDRLPFEDSTIEVVKAHHIFEHLGEGFFHCLQELYRVCKNGAKIHIRVPHPRHDTFISDPTHRRPIMPMTLQMFSRKFNDMCRLHQVPTSYLGYYYGVDFELSEVKFIPDARYEELLKTISEDQRNAYADQHFNLCSEIEMILVVVKDDK